VLSAGSAVFLYISYAMPLASGMFAEGNSSTEKGQFQFGVWSKPCAHLATIGACVLAYVGIQPPNEKGFYMLIGFVVALLVIWYGFGVRKSFAGPPSMKSDANDARIRELEADVDRTI
jgi:amino acid transporter